MQRVKERAQEQQCWVRTEALLLCLSPAETPTRYVREISRHRGIQSHPSLPPPPSTQESPVQELPQVGLVWEPCAPTCGGFVQLLAVPRQHPVLRVQWIIHRECEKSTAVVFELQPEHFRDGHGTGALGLTLAMPQWAVRGMLLTKFVWGSWVSLPEEEEGFKRPSGIPGDQCTSNATGVAL